MGETRKRPLHSKDLSSQEPDAWAPGGPSYGIFPTHMELDTKVLEDAKVLEGFGRHKGFGRFWKDSTVL